MKYDEKIYKLFIDYCKREREIIIYDDYRDHENPEYMLYRTVKNTTLSGNISYKKELLNKDEFIDNIMDAYSDSESYYVDSFIDEFRNSLNDRYKDYFDNHIDDLRYDLQDLVYDYMDIEYPIESFLNDEIKINIFWRSDVSSGYDDEWLPFLLHSQGYLCKDHPYLKKMLNSLHVYHKEHPSKKELKQYDDDYKNSVFFKSLIDEIENCYLDSPRDLCFIASISIRDYFNLLEKNKTFTINKDVVCGLVDYYNGGGSILNIALERDIKVNTSDIHILIEGIHKYSVNDIYGLCSSEYKDVVGF